MSKKILTFGSIAAVVILVLASFPSIVNAQESSNNLINDVNALDDRRGYSTDINDLIELIIAILGQIFLTLLYGVAYFLAMMLDE